MDAAFHALIEHGVCRESRPGSGVAVISTVTFLVAWGSRHLPWAGWPQKALRDPWAAFLRGRVLDGCREAPWAFRFSLVAAQDGLPVTAAFAWLLSRVGVGGHGQKPGGPSW